MGFPENVIASDEKVVLHLHPHWKVLFGPTLVFVLTVAAAAVLATVIPAEWNWALLALIGVGVLLVAAFTVWPYVKWVTTHIVFTSHRVILRSGVFTRSGRDIPHARINDVSFEQTLFERMLRCGTLTVASASEHGQQILQDIPKVERAQGILYQLVETDHERRSGLPPQGGQGRRDDPGY